MRKALLAGGLAGLFSLTYRHFQNQVGEIRKASTNFERTLPK